MQSLIITAHGTYVGKESERVVVKKGDRVLREIPFFRLGEIVLPAHGAALSTDVIAEACERGIRISLLDGHGKPYAMLSSPHLTATVATRRAQMAAYLDGRSVAIAKAIVGGKLRNQASLLKYFGKYLKGADAGRFRAVVEAVKGIAAQCRAIRAVEGARIDDVREALMGHEGAAATAYWGAVRVLLEGKADFKGREHQGAKDPVNASLNYGYGILYNEMWGAVLNAGLEPFAGFLHVDRSGKPSLVLDLVEEFRGPVVDRAVIAFFTKGGEARMENGLLDHESRRTVASRVLERLDSEAAFEGKTYRVRSILQQQARHLATAVRGERDYAPFSFKW